MGPSGRDRRSPLYRTRLVRVAGASHIIAQILGRSSRGLLRRGSRRNTEWVRTVARNSRTVRAAQADFIAGHTVRDSRRPPGRSAPNGRFQEPTADESR